MIGESGKYRIPANCPKTESILPTCETNEEMLSTSVAVQNMEQAMPRT